jgi:hypothetical protein
MWDGQIRKKVNRSSAIEKDMAFSKRFRSVLICDHSLNRATIMKFRALKGLEEAEAMIKLTQSLQWLRFKM